MIRTTVTAGLALYVASALPAWAQSKPRTYQATVIHANCIRTYSDKRNCDRTLEVVRGRYGDTVTMMQWNSGAGVVRHLNRQGK